MKKFLLGMCLLALPALPALAQTAPEADVVVVRIEHFTNTRNTITTSFGANSTQVKEIAHTSNGVKEAAAITEATQQALAPLLQQGYTLKSMSGGDYVTLLVLTKQK
jgi:hypothetical protein